MRIFQRHHNAFYMHGKSAASVVRTTGNPSQLTAASTCILLHTICTQSHKTHEVSSARTDYTIVGYQQNAVSAGYKMVTPTFVNIAGGEYSIDDFQVIGVEDTQANIQVMDSAGQWTGMYYWFNAFGDYPAGWFDFNAEVAAGITLKPGDAIFFNTNIEGVKLQSAGQVPGVITNSVPTGYSMIGNGSPVAIEIDDIKLIGVGDTQANIQVMNAAGQWTGMYYWFNEYGDLPSGWFDFNAEVPAGITLQPGDSVFFNTNISGAKVVIPSAL